MVRVRVRVRVEGLRVEGLKVRVKISVVCFGLG